MHPYCASLYPLHVRDPIPCVQAVHWNFAMGASAAKERVTDTNFRIYPQV